MQTMLFARKLIFALCFNYVQNTVNYECQNEKYDAADITIQDTLSSA